MCDAEDAHARLDAALHSVHRGGHMAGCTKCSTASNTRPTILDYYYAFTHSEWAALRDTLCAVVCSLNANSSQVVPTNSGVVRCFRFPAERSVKATLGCCCSPLPVQDSILQAALC